MEELYKEEEEEMDKVIHDITEKKFSEIFERIITYDFNEDSFGYWIEDTILLLENTKYYEDIFISKLCEYSNEIIQIFLTLSEEELKNTTHFFIIDFYLVLLFNLFNKKHSIPTTTDIIGFADRLLPLLISKHLKLLKLISKSYSVNINAITSQITDFVPLLDLSNKDKLNLLKTFVYAIPKNTEEGNYVDWLILINNLSLSKMTAKETYKFYYLLSKIKYSSDYFDIQVPANIEDKLIKKLPEILDSKMEEKKLSTRLEHIIDMCIIHPITTFERIQEILFYIVITINRDISNYDQIIDFLMKSIEDNTKFINNVLEILIQNYSILSFNQKQTVSTFMKYITKDTIEKIINEDNNTNIFHLYH